MVAVDRIFYGDINNWIPDNATPLGTSPLKTIRVAFHIFQADPPDPNYFLDNQATIDFMNNDVLGPTNGNRYSCAWGGNNCAPTDPILAPNEELPNFDTQIRFELADRIFFYQDNALNQGAGRTMNERANYFGFVAQQNPNFDVDAHLNIFWTQGTLPPPFNQAGAHASLAAFNDLTERPFVFMFTEEAAASHAAFAHEIGHNLDLQHTYIGGGANVNCDTTHPDYLDDLFNATITCPHTDANWNLDAQASPTDGITNNLMGQWLGNQYISPMQAGKMHRALALSNMRNFVDGCPYSNVPLEITQDETWDFDIRLYRDIVVTAGNILTITCSVRLPDDARIIVERGAKLILDGGNITNACEPDPANNIEGMWAGIEVWGHANTPHQNANGQLISPAELLATDNTGYPQDTTHQGVVVLTNGAILENAQNAIRTRRTGGYFPEYYGGIVYAEDSEFLNNGRAVEFMQFEPEGFSFNASRFEDCTFLINEDYYHNCDYQFVTIWDVQWEEPDLNAANPIFTFNNCEFGSAFNPFEVFMGNATTTQRGLYAIHTEDAQFYVNGSRFVQMEIGIDAWNTPNLLRDIWVIGTNDEIDYDFHHNLMGIQTNSYFTTRIDHNSFLGLTDASGSLVSSGIYCFGNDLYDIYDNIFQDLHSGIIAARTDNIPNNIWGNTVRDGNFAISALGGNNDLQISCNDMDRMNFDIGVFNDGQPGSINPVQGGAPDPGGDAEPTIAGNLFSDFATCPFSDTHVTNANNENNAYFRYIFSSDNPRWIPRCIEDQTFHPILNLQSNITFPLEEPEDYDDCIVNGGGGNPQGGLPNGVYNPCSDKPCLDEMANYIQTEEQPLKDGAAQSLKDALNNAPTSAATKTTLLDKSPYLSDEVLTLTVNQTALNETDAKDILVANAPLSGIVWEAINNRQPAFSNATITTIQQAGSGQTISVRDALADWVTTVAYKRDKALYQLVAAEVRDRDWTEALSFLQGENSDAAQQLSVRLHLANGDLSSATTGLNAMHSSTLDHVYFKDIQNLYISLVQNGKTYFDINTTEEDMLRTIAHSHTKAAAKARSILTLVTGETFSLFLPSLPNGSSKHFTRAVPNLSPLFQLQPNPSRAGTWLALEEGFSEEQVEVVVYDLQGKEWQSYQLEQNQQKLWIPTDQLREGVYICILKVNGVHQEQVKMVVLK